MKKVLPFIPLFFFNFPDKKNKLWLYILIITFGIYIQPEEIFSLYFMGKPALRFSRGWLRQRAFEDDWKNTYNTLGNDASDNSSG